MAETLPVAPGGTVFTIMLQTDGSLAAEDLGQLLLSLSQDYRRHTKGRTLSVVKVEQRCIILLLADAFRHVAPFAYGSVEAVKAANSIHDFVSKLKKLMHKEKEDSGGKRPQRKIVGQKSIESMLKLAADSKSQIEVRYTSSEGETLDIRLTPQEAIVVKSRREDEAKEAPMLPKSAQYGAIRDERMRNAVAQLAAAPEDEVLSLIRILVNSFLGAGLGESFLHKLAYELDSQGLHRIAAALRAELPRNSEQQQLLEGPPS